MDLIDYLGLLGVASPALVVDVVPAPPQVKAAARAGVVIGVGIVAVNNAFGDPLGALAAGAVTAANRGTLNRLAQPFTRRQWCDLLQ